MTTEHDQYIRMAITLAERGDTPFGALIVQHGQVISTGYNTVHTDKDITAHSEMQAIRAAMQELGTTRLEDCTIYSNAEPCPMCMAAILWSGIPRLVFGATAAELSEYVPCMQPTARELAAQSGRTIHITSGILEDLCLAPFRLKHQGKS